MASPALGLSEKQQAMRAEGMGASEVATALGLNPFKTAAELAAEKRHDIEPVPAGEPALWGQRFERPIADEFIARRRAEGHAWSIFTPPTMRHPASKVLMATCDRVVVPEGRRARSEWIAEAEFKNLSFFRRDEFGEAEDDVPEPIIVQIQVQLEVTGLDFAWLGAVLGGQKYIEKRIVRDREMGGQLVQFVEKWWADHVIQGIPVPVDGSEASSAYLRRRFPSEHGPLLAPSPEAEQLAVRLRAAKAALAQATDAEAEIGNALRALIGEASGVEGIATWKANKPSQKVDLYLAVEGLLLRLEENPPSGGFSLPREKLRALWAEVVSDFTTTKPGARVLRLLKGE
jgi:putative phage-type endonuclease